MRVGSKKGQAGRDRWTDGPGRTAERRKEQGERRREWPTEVRERRGKQKGETVTDGQRATSERDRRRGREREMEAERKAGTDWRKRGKTAGEK